MSDCILSELQFGIGDSLGFHLAVSCLGPFCIFHLLAAVVGKLPIPIYRHSSLGEGRVNDPGKMSRAGVSKTTQSASQRYLCPEFNIFTFQWSCPGGLARDALT